MIHGPVDVFFDSWVYNGLLVTASLACLARGLAVRAERLPWLLLGIALALWTTGDLYYFFAFSSTANVPIPSVADPFYLAFYPVSYVALALLLRRRMQDFRGNLWLDGVIASLAVAALGAAVVFDEVLKSTGGSTLVVATNLAYPLADVAPARPRRRHVRTDRLAVRRHLGVRRDRFRGVRDVGQRVPLRDRSRDLQGRRPARRRLAAGAGADRVLRPGSRSAGSKAYATKAGRRSRCRRPSRSSGSCCSSTTTSSASTRSRSRSRRPRSPPSSSAPCSRSASACSCWPLAARRRLTDALTGLGNRRRFMLELDAAFADESRAVRARRLRPRRLQGVQRLVRPLRGRRAARARRGQARCGGRRRGSRVPARRRRVLRAGRRRGRRVERSCRTCCGSADGGRRRLRRQLLVRRRADAVGGEPAQ